MTAIDEMSRVAGQLETGLKSLENQLEKMNDKLTSIDTRLSHIEMKESERRGAWKIAVVIAGSIGAAVSTAFWKLLPLIGLPR